MLPPDNLLRRGITCLPCMGDGRLITTDQTPWQEFYRARVNQLEEGAVLATDKDYYRIHELQGVPRNSH